MEFFGGKIGRFEKRYSLSEKKTPLTQSGGYITTELISKKKSIFLPPPFLVLWLGVTKELCALYVGVSVKASITDKRLARLLLLVL